MSLDVTDFPLSDAEFARVRARVYEMAGISLGDSKRTLVIARLSKLVRTRGLNSFDAYLNRLEDHPGPGDLQEFINALTTNLTRFWREEHHFTHLVGYVGELMKSNTHQATRRLRIWSAGCSTGQEPFTIALSLLSTYPDLKRWDFRVLATDIDTAVLAKAASATYPVSEVAGLPAERRRLFEVLPDDRVRVPAEFASVISFKPLNLMGDWPMKGPFDAIFCRNVTIYFDKQTQREVFERLGAILMPGGFLYIGHSEHMGAGNHGCRLVGKTIYQAAGVQQPVAAKTRGAA
jgi:chemotaxis protein methyltransferase CheR